MPDVKFEIIETKMIAVEKIDTGDNMRVENVQVDIESLIASIRSRGQLQPIRVFAIDPDSSDTRYSVLVGQRRFLAFKELAASDPEYAEIRAEIIQRPPGLDEESFKTSVWLDSFVENDMRANPTEADFIRACTEFFRVFADVQIVAEKVGRSVRDVRKYIKAARLVPELDQMVRAGRLDLNHALRLQDSSTDDETHVIDVERALTLAGMANREGRVPNPFIRAAVQNQDRTAEEVVDLVNNPPPATNHRMVLLIDIPIYNRVREKADRESLTDEEAAIDLIETALSLGPQSSAQGDEEEEFFD